MTRRPCRTHGAAPTASSPPVPPRWAALGSCHRALAALPALGRELRNGSRRAGQRPAVPAARAGRAPTQQGELCLLKIALAASNPKTASTGVRGGGVRGAGLTNTWRRSGAGAVSSGHAARLPSRPSRALPRPPPLPKPKPKLTPGACVAHRARASLLVGTKKVRPRPLRFRENTRAATPARACTRRGRAPATGSSPGTSPKRGPPAQRQRPRRATRASLNHASATASYLHWVGTASRGPATARTPSAPCGARRHLSSSYAYLAAYTSKGFWGQSTTIPLNPQSRKWLHRLAAGWAAARASNLACARQADDNRASEHIIGLASLFHTV